jgi:hypothetical protein
VKKITDKDLQENELLRVLLDLPNKILQHEELDHLPHLVLHELGKNQRLGFKRASYLIYNPDFGCIKGIAGYCQDETKFHKDDLWHDPASFHDDMKSANFYNKIKTFYHPEIYHKECNDKFHDDIKNIGKMLGIDKPLVHVWNMRHGNKGVLIFEEDQKHGKCEQDPVYLDKLAALLGLCRAY